MAAASRCLWAAAAGPLPRVHTLVLRSSTQQHVLASLQHRFPNIQQLHVADGCRQWTCLGTWAASLRVLQAKGTSFPLAAVLSPSLPRVCSASGNRHPHRQQHQQRQQQHQHQAAVPAELCNLVHLQLQSTVTSVVKCSQHGSQCGCLVSDWLCHTASDWCVSRSAVNSSHFRVQFRVTPAGQPDGSTTLSSKTRPDSVCLNFTLLLPAGQYCAGGAPAAKPAPEGPRFGGKQLPARQAAACRQPGSVLQGAQNLGPVWL